MREQYESQPVAQLRQIAREMGIAHISALRKAELIDAILAAGTPETPKKETVKPEPEEGKTDGIQNTGTDSSQGRTVRNRQSGRSLEGRQGSRMKASEREQAAASQTAPEQNAPGQNVSSKTTSGQNVSGKAAPGQTASGKTMSGQNTTGRQNARPERNGKAQGQARQQRQGQAQGQQAASGRSNVRPERTGQNQSRTSRQAQDQGQRPSRTAQDQGQRVPRTTQDQGHRQPRSSQVQGQAAPQGRAQTSAPVQNAPQGRALTPAPVQNAPQGRVQVPVPNQNILQNRDQTLSSDTQQSRMQTPPVTSLQSRVPVQGQEEPQTVPQTSAQTQPQPQNQMASASAVLPAPSTPSASPAPGQTSRQSELAAIDSGNTATGILEIIPDGYGFLRSENYLPGENDVYVAPSQIRKFNLKTGDVVTGNTRVKAQQEKYSALLYIKSINGFTPEAALRRHQFEDMTPVFPNERLRMERGSKDVAMRIVDLFSPVGKGQRGMIVSPPKAGKTTLLKEMATSILKNNPSMHIIIMLIDERPEEVTDIREAIVGDNVEVLYSTFDELPEHHKRVSEMGIERAKRLVEYGQDVVILLDSITRLARAYNLTVQPSGRTLSGGLDPAALHMPKRFFGAARNMREGGSLTVLATALVDTGSKMDDVVYEEFKGTGNMELVLDRKLSERRVFPAIDIQKSGTRREDLLLDENEQEAVYYMRRALNGLRSDEAVESILNLFVHTRSNEELVSRIRMQRRV